MNYTTKVIVEHYRLVESFDDSLLFVRWKRKNHYGSPHPKGGQTNVVIRVYDENDELVKVCAGIASCSLKDNFCYKLGREIAMGRALKKFELWRDEFAYAHPEYRAIEVKPL